MLRRAQRATWLKINLGVYYQGSAGCWGKTLHRWLFNKNFNQCCNFPYELAKFMDEMRCLKENEKILPFSVNKMNSCKILTSGWLLKEDCCWFGWIWVVEECQLCVSISLSTFISTSSTADVCNYSQLPAIYFPIFKPIFLAVCVFCSGSKLKRSSCLFFLSSWL